jgi:hypothetical protein
MSAHLPKPSKVEPFVLRHHPWATPDPEYGVMPGAANGWCIDRRLALLFHTTTKEYASAILRDGFSPSPPIEVGGWALFGGPDGRKMPSGVWVSIRPTIPNDSDIWMPDLCAHDWVVLQVVVPLDVLPDRCVFEHTWPVAQFCLQPADVLNTTILSPAEMPPLIHPETVRMLASYRGEHHRQSPYLDALDMAAARASAAVGRLTA